MREKGRKGLQVGIFRTSFNSYLIFAPLRRGFFKMKFESLAKRRLKPGYVRRAYAFILLIDLKNSFNVI